MVYCRTNISLVFFNLLFFLSGLASSLAQADELYKVERAGGIHHDEEVLGQSVSNDGKLLLFRHSKQLTLYPLDQTFETLTAVGSVNSGRKAVCAQLSPNGETIVSAWRSGHQNDQIRVWRTRAILEAQKESKTVKVRPDVRFRIPAIHQVSDVIFSPDSRRVVIRSDRYTALYSVDDLLAKIPLARWSSDKAEAVQFAKDSSRLLVFDQGVVSQVSMRDFKETFLRRWAFPLGEQPTEYLSFSATGQYVLSYFPGFGGRSVLELDNKERFGWLLRSPQTAIFNEQGTFSPDEKYFLSVFDDGASGNSGHVELFSLVGVQEAKQPEAVFGLSSKSHWLIRSMAGKGSVSFDPYNRWILTNHESSEFPPELRRVTSALAGDAESVLLVPDIGKTSMLEFMPDGQHLISSVENDTVFLQIKTAQELE